MPNDFAATVADIKDIDLPWDLARPEEAEARFRAEIKKREAAGPLDAAALEMMTQIARAASLRGGLDEAEAMLTEVAKHLSETTEAAPRLRYLLELGRIFTLKKTPSRARAVLLEVWERAVAVGQDFLAVDAAQMLSIVEPPKSSGDWLLKALNIATNSKAPRVQIWLGDLHAALGWHYYDLLQLDKARTFFTQAIAHFEREGWAKKRILASCGLSRVYRAQNRFPEAFAIQERLLAEMKTANVKHSLVYEELAECLHAMKRGEEATEYFAKAHDLLAVDAWHKDNNPARMVRLKKLGKLK